MKMNIGWRNTVCQDLGEFTSKELGMRMSDLAKCLNHTEPAVSIAGWRGEKFVRENQI